MCSKQDSFAKNNFGDTVHEQEVKTIRYMLTDRDRGIMFWFIKTSPDEIKGMYDTYRTVMNMTKLEPPEKKKRTHTVSVCIHRS